jgi:hypothetical protein
MQDNLLGAYLTVYPLVSKLKLISAVKADVILQIHFIVIYI